jgi:tetratricopeptide (TPR) repeat protein
MCCVALVPRNLFRGRSTRALVPIVVVAFVALSAWRSTDYARTERLWEATLAGNPASDAAHASLAQVHRDRAVAAAARGQAHVAEREMWAAIGAIDHARALNPRHVPYQKAAIRLRLALGAERGRPAVALVLAERLLARRPDDPLLRILVAQAGILTGRATGEERFLAEGERMALSCLEIAAPKGLVFRVAAEARVAAGDPEGALAHLDASIARGLDHVSVRVDRAAVLMRLGRRDEARAELGVILRDDPFEPSARRLLTELSAAAPGR